MAHLSNVRVSAKYPSPEKSRRAEAPEQSYVAQSRQAVKAASQATVDGDDYVLVSTPSPARRGPSLDVDAINVDAILEQNDHLRKTSPRSGEGAAVQILAGREPLDVGAILANHDHVRRSSSLGHE